MLSTFLCLHTPCIFSFHTILAILFVVVLIFVYVSPLVAASFLLFACTMRLTPIGGRKPFPPTPWGKDMHQGCIG